MLCAVSELAILFASVRAVASRAIAPRHGADSTFNPLVTYPTAGVVWYSGGDYTVSWVRAPLPLDPSGAKRRRSRGTLTLGATRQNPPSQRASTRARSRVWRTSFSVATRMVPQVSVRRLLARSAMLGSGRATTAYTLTSQTGSWLPTCRSTAETARNQSRFLQISTKILTRPTRRTCELPGAGKSTSFADRPCRFSVIALIGAHANTSPEFTIRSQNAKSSPL